MANQVKLLMETLSPQPSLSTPGTPQRLTTSNIYCTSFLIHPASGNTGLLYVASSESNATTTNRVLVDSSLSVTVDNFADLDGLINLRDIWFDGENSSDKLVVFYFAPNRDYWGELSV